MDSHYQAPATALKYLEFLNSENGKIQKSILFDAIKSKLPKNPELTILDLGCGPGWLSGMLNTYYKNVEACDSSEFFIRFAKIHFKGVDFKVAALNHPLPYAQNHFYVVILNMVGPDLENLTLAFKNIAPILTFGGKLIMTVPNPKYTYPAAEWKRGLLGRLLLQKPKLKLKTPPVAGTKIQREFGKNTLIDSYYHTLDAYVQAAKNSGLSLSLTQELKPKVSSKKFDLNYQLQKYPLLLLLEFKKIS